MQIATVDKDEIFEYGRYLLNHLRELGSFEEASVELTRSIFNEFASHDEPEFALVRVFRTSISTELPAKLRQGTLPNKPYLALMGTTGVEENWCERQKSANRQLIAIGETMSPMFKGVFHELGFNWRDFSGESTAKGEALASMGMVRYFHVPDASQSQAITDQDKFVQVYGIQSVLALGTKFLSGAAYVLIGFSFKPISQAQAEVLVQLAPHVSTLLALYDGRKKIWG